MFLLGYRTRSLQLGSIGGGWARGLAGQADVYGGGGHAATKYIYDTNTGDKVHTNDLDLWYNTNGVVAIDGKTSSFWQCENYHQIWDFGVKDRNEPGLPSYTAAATMAMARLNPSRPSVDIVQFLAELRDAPRMIFQIGDLLRRMTQASRAGRSFRPTAKDYASGYLGWTFGWDPLISDLRKLFNWSEHVNKRMSDLQRLKSGRLVKETTTFHVKYKESWGGHYGGPLYQAQTIFALESEIEVRQWVSVRYVPTNATLRLLDGDMYALARSLVYGHQPDWSTVWELMPWSWLIDWFTTAGDFFAANRNHLHLRLDDVSVMTYRSARPLRAYGTTNPHGARFRVANADVAYHKQRRWGWNVPTVTAKEPFLSLKQWSILSALAVMRHR